MINDRDWERLARFVTSEATPDEAENTRQWLESDSARLELSQRMREAWELAKVDDSWNSRAAWHRIASQRDDAGVLSGIATQNITPRTHPQVKFGRRSGDNKKYWFRWPAVAGIAAALVLVAGGAVATRVLKNGAAPTPRVAKAEVMNEILTRRAQRATIQLTDGTRITLNVDSRLRYPQGYGVTSRDLYLEGEAFFDVAHSSIPFIVHTAQGSARDVGTRFVVTAYPSTGDTKVVVAEGSVVLASRGLSRNATALANSPSRQAAAAYDSVVLTSAKLGVASASGEVTAADGIDVADHLAWMEGKLVFVGAPLSEVVQRLSRWYDIDVRLAGASLEKVRFSGTFQTENPGYVLNLLAVSAGARLSRSGAAYVLSSRR